MHPRLPTPDSRLPAARRGGYTLVELMVVMIIMVILVATALPLVKRVMDNDRVREASRQLSSYISMAKTRAMQTGRPCGLLLVLEPPLGVPAAPFAAGPQYVRQCTQLYLAEVPPTYQGSTQGARGRILSSTLISPPGPPGTFEFYPITPGPNPPGGNVQDDTEMQYLIGGTSPLINPGEQFLVRFEHKGAWYVCQRGITPPKPAFPTFTDPNRLYYTGSTVMGVPTPLPPGINDTTSTPFSNPGYYYTIMRSPQPVGEPMELTGGTCIDMTFSGAGQIGNGFIQANGSLGILFSSSGGVTGLYFDGSSPVPPDGTLHLLLGRVSKMNQPDAPSQANPPHVSNMRMFSPEESNLADATSLWVSIGRANGSVTTSENVPDTAFPGPYTIPGGATFLGIARSVATGREQMGGQ